jgi:hypothetical protein
MIRSWRPRTILISLCVGACAGGGAFETRRDVEGDAAAVRSRIADGLAGLGWRVATREGRVLTATLENAPSTWASCPPALVGGGDDQRRMATVNRRQGRVTVSLDPVASGSRVTLHPRFFATYRNPITGYGFERACRSKGIFERQLLDAVASS